MIIGKLQKGYDSSIPLFGAFEENNNFGISFPKENSF